MKKRGKLWAWVVFALGAAYFLIPLLATFEFSLRIRREGYTFDAYMNVFSDGRFQATFGYSLVVGLAAILVGIFIVVPAAYLVRLRLPALRPVIEFVTLLPLIIPAIILVFGYIKLYNSSSWLPLTGSALAPTSCSPSAMSRWRCPICIAPSIPACAPSMSRR